jgi:azurin
VLAATRLIGGGETASVTFFVASMKPGEEYAYFCSFPGHASMMRGTLALAH